MARQIIDNGSYDNDPTAEKIRLAFNKTNDNFEELYSYLTGTGKAQERIIAYIESGETELVEVANSINAASPIIKPRDTLQIISFIDPYGGGLGMPNYFKKRQYILKLGEGTYGAAGTPVSPSDLITLTPNIIGINEATTFNLGNIMGADIHTYVNGSGPYLVVGTTIFETTEGSYIFSGADGLYGVGEIQTIPQNFIAFGVGVASNNWEKIHNLSLVGITTDGVDELTYIANAVILYGPFTCEPDQQIVLRTQTPSGTGLIERYYAVIPRVTTIGGSLGAVVYPSYFRPDGQSITTEIPTSIIVELGDILTGPVEDYFNEGDGGLPWDMSVKRFIRGTLDGDVTLWSWQGEDGEFGGSGTPATADDFFLITGEPTVPIGQLYNPYANISSLLSSQLTQSTETIIRVLDASADTNITFPIGETKLWAYYQYLGTPNGLISDYRLVSVPYGNKLNTKPLVTADTATVITLYPFGNFCNSYSANLEDTAFTFALTDSDNPAGEIATVLIKTSGVAVDFPTLTDAEYVEGAPFAIDSYYDLHAWHNGATVAYTFLSRSNWVDPTLPDIVIIPDVIGDSSVADWINTTSSVNIILGLGTISRDNNGGSFRDGRFGNVLSSEYIFDKYAIEFTLSLSTTGYSVQVGVGATSLKFVDITDGVISFANSGAPGTTTVSDGDTVRIEYTLGKMQVFVNDIFTIEYINALIDMDVMESIYKLIGITDITNVKQLVWLP